MPVRPSTFRGRGGTDQDHRTPATEPLGQPRTRAVTGAPKGSSARGSQPRKRGGGGAGITKPRRQDPQRQRMVAWAPGQKEGLQLACQLFYSPTGRMEACRHRREHGEYHPDLPLTPVRKRSPCHTPECHCEMKHSQLQLELALGSPSQVKRARVQPTALCPPSPPIVARALSARPAAAQSVNFKYEAGPAGTAARAARDAGRKQNKEERKRAKKERADTEDAAAAAAVFQLMGPASGQRQDDEACGFALLLSASLPF